MLVYVNLNLIFEATAYLDRGSPFFRLQVVLDAVFRKAAYFLETRRLRPGVGQRIAFIFLQQSKTHYWFRRRVEAQQEWPARLERQLDDVHFFPHIDTRDVHVRAPEELQCDVGLA